MLDEWIEFHSSYVVAGKFSLDKQEFPAKKLQSGTLSLQFKSGYVAVYKGVPLTVWEGMLEAPSKGVYFHRSVRGRGYSEGSRG